MTNKEPQWGDWQRDIVFIIGGGASAADGMLLQDKWFKEIFRRNSGHSTEKKILNRRKRKLKDMFADLFSFKKDKTTKQYPSIESVFNLFDTAISKYHSIGEYSPDRVGEIYDYLYDSLAMIMRTRKKGKHYKNLIEAIVNKYKSENIIPVAFITFNYDLLLDRQLIDLSGDKIKPAKQIDVDYGIEIGTYRRDGIKEFYGFTPPRKKNILLLRPHGSLNWVHCKACGSIFTTRQKNIPLKAVLHEEACPACHKTAGILLIYPGYDRSYEEPFLASTWDLTEKTLRYAKKWCFIGCALPDADRYFQYILLRAYLSRPKSKRPEIWVVDYLKKCEKCNDIAPDNYKKCKERQSMTNQKRCLIIDENRHENLKQRYKSLFTIKNRNISSEGFANFIIAQKNGLNAFLK